MNLRPMGKYPTRDLTPEHTLRGKDHNSDATIHPQVGAAYEYVESVVDAADIEENGSPAWYGWALREAFLAGCSHAAKTPNVRAKRATTAGRQARAGENVPRTTRPGLVACRWRSA